MRRCLAFMAGMLLLWIPAGRPGVLHAQMAGPSFSTWTGGPPIDQQQRYLTVHPVDLRAPRSHTATGLLVGGLIGAAATTIFLVGFCSDADTACGADEVGRAVLFIAVPCAAVGAVIGSLVRTD